MQKRTNRIDEAAVCGSVGFNPLARYWQPHTYSAILHTERVGLR